VNRSRPVSSEAWHARQHAGRGMAGEREGGLAFRPCVATALAANAAADSTDTHSISGGSFASTSEAEATVPHSAGGMMTA
jgi:hypothetical protein